MNKKDTIGCILDLQDQINSRGIELKTYGRDDLEKWMLHSLRLKLNALSTLLWKLKGEGIY